MARSIGYRAGMVILFLLACGTGAVQALESKCAPPPPSPEATVTHYLEALKAGDFATAYDCISAAMAQHKGREAWVKEQQWTMQMSDAKIFDFHVYPGKLDGTIAHVPDILSSQDKFLNQLGVPEHELYTLVREDGRWKIDQQQLLEKSEQGKWFPVPAQAQ